MGSERLWAMKRSAQRLIAEVPVRQARVEKLSVSTWKMSGAITAISTTKAKGSIEGDYVRLPRHLKSDFTQTHTCCPMRDRHQEN